MRKTIILGLLLSGMFMFAESREVVCEACEQAVQMTDSTISRIGNGCAATQQEADSIAFRNARAELVNLLRDSIAEICYKVAVVRKAGEEYIEYQMFSDQPEQKTFFFAQEGILAETPIICRNSIQDKDGRYHSCYVLETKRKELSKGSTIIMFEILERMPFFL